MTAQRFDQKCIENFTIELNTFTLLHSCIILWALSPYWLSLFKVAVCNFCAISRTKDNCTNKLDM